MCDSTVELALLELREQAQAQRMSSQRRQGNMSMTGFMGDTETASASDSHTTQFDLRLVTPHMRKGRLKQQVAASRIRCTELLPELLIGHERDVLLLHLHWAAIGVKAPDWSHQAGKPPLCSGVPLASGPPCKHPGWLLHC